MRRLLSRASAIAREDSAYRPYTFETDAFCEQDVNCGLGLENAALLRHIQKDVAPDREFLRLKEGHFNPL